MKDNITRLWGHILSLLFTTTLLLVGINFFQWQPILSAFILTIFAAIYLAAAPISRQAFTVYPATLLLVAAYNLVLYRLGVPVIYLPLVSSPLVFVLYVVARQFPRPDLGFVSDGLNGSALLLVLGLALIILIQVNSYAATAPVVASLTLILLALHFVLRFALERKTWHQWAFILLVVPGYLFLLHAHAPAALYLATAVILLVPVWNLTRRELVGESVLLIATAVYVGAAAYLQWPETASLRSGQALIPLGYAAGALALVSLSVSQHRWLRDMVPALASGLMLTVIPITLTYPWNQYTAMFPYLALVFFLYILSGSLPLRRERTMIGLIIGHSHVAFGEVVAMVALAYTAFKGFPLGYANALTALLMAAVAVLAGLRVQPIVVRFRRHFFYLAGLFLTFSFLTALWRANPLGNTAANLSLVALLVLLLYAVAAWARSRIDQAGYITLLEVPAIPVAIAGALYVLGRPPGISADLLVPIGLMLPGMLFYGRLKRPETWAAPVVGLAVLVLTVLMAAGVPLVTIALIFLALGAGLAAWEVQSEAGDWSYVRLFALGVATLTSLGLTYPWREPLIFGIAAWPVVYLITASVLQAKERRVARVGLEASGYGLMLLVGVALILHALVLQTAIIAAVYALTFFVITARIRRAVYLYPTAGFTVLAAFLAALVTGRGAWYVLLAFPLTAIFYATGVYNFPLSSPRVGRGEGAGGEARAPLYFGGHLNAVVGAAAFLLLAPKLDNVVALVGVVLHLVVYAWMAYRRQERRFLAGVGLSVALLLLIGLSFLPLEEHANVLGYFIPVTLLLLGYGWILRRRGDVVGSLAVLSAAGVVTLLASGAALWAEGLSPDSVWAVLVVGSLVWLGLLFLTRLDVYIYLITASLALLSYSFVRLVSDRFVNHVFIFLVYGCLLIALVFVHDLVRRRARFRSPIYFGQKVLRRDWLVYGLPVVVLAGVGLAGFGVESTSSPPFCGLCHKMSPYYASWQASAHGKAGVSCADCHYEPSAQAYVRNKIVGLSELVKTATATEGYRPIAVVSDRSCLRNGCHSTTELKKAPILVADRVPFGHGDHLERIQRGVEIHCAVCHAMVRVETHFSINQEACFLCHLKGRQEGPNTGDRCLVCHNYILSTPTKGGFSHQLQLASQQAVDCTACHQGVTLGNGNVKEECGTCHVEDPQTLLKGNPARIHQRHVTGEGVSCDRCHEKIRHGVKVAVPSAAAPTLTPAPVPTKAAAGTPPKTPMSHVRRIQCLICHAVGGGGAPKVPNANPDHTAFKDDNNASLCWSCHPLTK